MGTFDTNAVVVGLLVDARHRAGLSQRELARKAGTSAAAVAQCESGHRDVKMSTLFRLVEACDMELRLEAAELTDAERDQYARDTAVGIGQAYANAAQARAAVRSIRPAAAAAQ